MVLKTTEKKPQRERLADARPVVAKGDLIFINHEHQMENKEETESILVRLDEVKQENLNSNKTYPSHLFSLIP